jgi:gluconokinase
MKNGIGLTDNDRASWLEAIRNQIISKSDNAVIACSALKKSYRDFLAVPNKQVIYIYLKGDREILEKRLTERKGHYAGPDLLESQLATLEDPIGALVMDIDNKPQAIVERILEQLDL